MRKPKDFAKVIIAMAKGVYPLDHPIFRRIPSLDVLILDELLS